MGRYKYLLNHIALFTISNFASKILVFLLVPFYTNVMSTEDYGVADVMQATLLLLVPALTLNIGEAVLRFSLEKGRRREDIFYIGVKYTAASAAVVAVVCLAAGFLAPEGLRGLFFIFIPLFLFNAFYEFFILFFQGSERVPIVVAGSVLCTLVLCLSNILFLVVVKIGLYGYLLSQILAFACGAAAMLLLSGAGKLIGNWKKDAALEREMLSYGKPMIAYSTASWVNNASDRYIVLWLCGAAVNGVYGVAYKIPAMLTVFQRIFAQAWQISATKSHGEEDSAEFYSRMYAIYNAGMVIGCSFLICAVRLLAQLMFRKEFFSAWTLVPPLLISIIFGALTGFLGSICLAYKDSKSMGLATSVGALANVVMNLLSVPILGAMGAAIATAISYFLMYFMAFLFVKRHVRLSVRLGRDYIAYAIVALQAVVMVCDVTGAYVIDGLLFAVLLFLYGKELLVMLRQRIRGKTAA